MSTRSYIGWVSKDKYNKIKDLSIDDKDELYKIINHDEWSCDDKDEPYVYIYQRNLCDDCFEVCQDYIPS